MKLRREKVLWNVLLGTSVYLLDSLRSRLSEGIDDISDRAHDTYGEVSRRTSRAMQAVRGDHGSGINSAMALLAGVGVGVGVGLLLAPASGKETRDTISNKVHDFGGRVRDKFSAESKPTTGTYGA